MHLGPLPTIVRGAAAGAVGTLVMDLLWYSRHRREGGHSGFFDWELSADATGWDDVPAPAQIGRRLAGSVGVELADSAAGLTNGVVHWATGVQWGALYGLAARSAVGTTPLAGALLGTVAWSTSYVVLPLAKLYRPIWEYDARTLAKDYSAHLLFGVATATAFAALGARGRS